MLLLLTSLLPIAGAAKEHPYRTQALAGAFHYNASVANAEPVQEAPASLPAGRPRKRVADPGERIPDATPAPTPIVAVAASAKETLVLPKITVPGAKPKQPPRLPQLHLRAPARNVGDGDAFETPKARTDRLIKKYYTTTEQGLGRLLLNSVGGWAARDAAIHASTEQLNDLAALIELSLEAGLEAPEDQQEIRAEYYRLLATKPR